MGTTKYITLDKALERTLASENNAEVMQTIDAVAETKCKAQIAALLYDSDTCSLLLERRYLPGADADSYVLPTLDDVDGLTVENIVQLLESVYDKRYLQRDFDSLRLTVLPPVYRAAEHNNRIVYGIIIEAQHLQTNGAGADVKSTDRKQPKRSWFPISDIVEMLNIGDIMEATSAYVLWANLARIRGGYMHAISY